jgi:hypothetical protein
VFSEMSLSGSANPETLRMSVKADGSNAQYRFEKKLLNS